MRTLKVFHVLQLLLLLAVRLQYVLSDESHKFAAVVPHVLVTKLEEKEHILDQVCATTPSGYYYCPGDTICCTPGSPTSLCCPADHPLCVPEGCCAKGHPKVCGNLCCISDNFCCGNNCCENEDTCCNSESCCSKEEPCCNKGNKPGCCNKETNVCCGGMGCGLMCSSPFDALGCESQELQSAEMDILMGNQLQEQMVNIVCPDPLSSKWQLYRVLRPEEVCSPGLVAKNPTDVTTTVQEHVDCGSTPGFTSQYISFTTSLDIAQRWKSKKPQLGLRIASIGPGTIPSACIKYDLTTIQRSSTYLTTQRAQNFARASCEVVLQCSTTPVPCTILQNFDESSEL